MKSEHIITIYMSDKSASGYIKKRRGKSKDANDYNENVRRAHKTYFSDDEWRIILEKADNLEMAPSVYVREVALGYKPVKPDRDFRRELMLVRDDLKKFFAFVSLQKWPQEERRKKLSDAGFLTMWARGIAKELKFLNYWIRRL